MRPLPLSLPRSGEGTLWHRRAQRPTSRLRVKCESPAATGRGKIEVRRSHWLNLTERCSSSPAGVMPKAAIRSRVRRIAQRREKRLDRGPVAAAFDQQEIVVLGHERQEREPVHPRHRLDRHAPVGAALRHRSRDRVVRARLVGVSRAASSPDQLVDQDARAGAGIAVDHEARGIGQRGFHRLFGALSLEALVAGAETARPAYAASLSPAIVSGASRCSL